MKNKITRRQFLKATGVLGGMAILRPIWDSGRQTAGVHAQSSSGEVVWIPSICNFCSSFCDINVAVKTVNGRKRAVKIEGNPNSPLNQGKICARGQAGLRQLYDPDRIKEPLIRVEGSKRGDWNFRVATWEEAYDYIASRFKKINPWEIAMVGGWTACVSYMHFSLPFVRTLQIPNIIASPMQHCVTAGHLGTDLVTGNFNVHDEILADFENARYILFSQNNASVAAISTARAVRFGKARKNGAKVVCLDPRQSELASKADEWIAIKPGTDHAFFLAMIHTMLRKELFDGEFLANHTNAPFLVLEDKNGNIELATDMGSDGKPGCYYVYDEIGRKAVPVPAYTNTNQTTASKKPIVPALIAPEDTLWNGRPVTTVLDIFIEKTRRFTPEWASTITDIPSETIERVATEFAEARPALVDPGWMGARYHHVISQRRMQAIVQTLVGGIDSKGGWLMNGEYRHKAENAWHSKQQTPEEASHDVPPVMLPGMGFAGGLIDIFANPASWSHGKPALSFAWAHEQQKQGKPSAFLPAMADNGLLEAVRGEMTWNGEPYRIKAFFMNAANPLRHYFPAERWKEMLSSNNLDLVVTVDVLPSDTTAFADVILPNHTYLERNEPLLYPLGPDTNLGFATRLRTVEPLYNTRDAADIFCEITDRMGKLEEYIESIAEYAGLDKTMLKKEIAEAKAEGKPYNEAFLKTAYAALGDLAEQVTGRKLTGSDVERTIREKGLIILKKADKLLEEAAMPRKIPLPTMSGRLELFSPILASFTRTAGPHPLWNPFLDYVPLTVSDDEKRKPLDPDEFYFTYGKIPVVSHASTNNNNALLAAVTKPKENSFIGLWINKRVAEKLGLDEGEAVEIENLRYNKKTRARLFVTEMIRPDTVFLPSSYGSENPKLRIAAEKGTALNELMPYSIEPLAASFMSQEFTVRIRPLKQKNLA